MLSKRLRLLPTKVTALCRRFRAGVRWVLSLQGRYNMLYSICTARGHKSWVTQIFPHTIKYEVTYPHLVVNYTLIKVWNLMFQNSDDPTLMARGCIYVGQTEDV